MPESSNTFQPSEATPAGNGEHRELPERVAKIEVQLEQMVTREDLQKAVYDLTEKINAVARELNEASRELHGKIDDTSRELQGTSRELHGKISEASWGLNGKKRIRPSSDYQWFANLTLVLLSVLMVGVYVNLLL